MKSAQATMSGIRTRRGREEGIDRRSASAAGCGLIMAIRGPRAVRAARYRLRQLAGVLVAPTEVTPEETIALAAREGLTCLVNVVTPSRQGPEVTWSRLGFRRA